MNFFNIFYTAAISTVNPASAPVKTGVWGSNWMMPAVTIGLLGVMWFFSQRDQKKKETERANMLNSIRIGDQIIVNGMVLRVKDIKEKGFMVDMTGHHEVFVYKYAVAAIYKEE